MIFNCKIIDEVDIYQYPTPIDSQASEITIGDLHSNPILLLYYLILYQIIFIDEDRFSTLVTIYRHLDSEEDDYDIEKDIEEFVAIINDFTVNPNKHFLRLLGDEVCDRGQNDYLIFVILNKLRETNVRFEILLSNHGFEFVNTFEKDSEKNWNSHHLDSEYTNSLNQMVDLILDNIIPAKLISSLVEFSYLPSLKLLSYTVQEQEIIIYSHAPIDLNVIQSLARFFKLSTEIEAISQLVKVINEINIKFESYVKEGRVHELIGVQPLSEIKTDALNFYQSDPVRFVIWNRNYKILDRSVKQNNYSVYFVHGHDSKINDSLNAISLDNELGKYINNNKGVSKIMEYSAAASLSAGYEHSLSHVSPSSINTSSSFFSESTKQNAVTSFDPNPIAAKKHKSKNI